MKNRYVKLFITSCVLLLCIWTNLLKPSTAYAYSLWGDPDQGDQTFWHHLRNSFGLKHDYEDPRVWIQIQWFRNHQKFLDHTLRNAAPYLYFISNEVQQRHLPGELVLLPVIESAYDPFAYSKVGAAGLWQLMPGTATGYGIKENWWYDGRRDIYASTTAALKHLSYLGTFFNGDWLDALASYDAGEGKVKQAIVTNARQGESTTFWNLPLPRETNDYVPRLLALAAIVSEPNRYGITLPPIKDKPYFAPVNIDNQIDLSHVANLAGISLKELYKLNPGFNRWATDPNGPHTLLLPIDKVQQFEQSFSQSPPESLVTWHRYQVQHGDSLKHIADEFSTRSSLLQEVNKLPNKSIHAGEVLLIPKTASNSSKSEFAPQFDYPNSTLKSPSIESNSIKDETSVADKGPRKLLVDIRVGDSLSKIAKQYSLKASQIKSWNKLNEKQALKVGRQLVLWLPPLKKESSVDTHTAREIPAKHEDPVPIVMSAENALQSRALFGEPTQTDTSNEPIHVNLSPTSAVNSEQLYRVKHGDMLSSIAKKFGTSTKAITQANQLQSSTLHLGQALRIPTATSTIHPEHQAKNKPAHHSTHSSAGHQYTVKKGDTLRSIAKAHHVSVKDLQKWNHASAGKYLKLGQHLVVR